MTSPPDPHTPSDPWAMPGQQPTPPVAPLYPDPAQPTFPSPAQHTSPDSAQPSYPVSGQPSYPVSGQPEWARPEWAQPGAEPSPVIVQIGEISVTSAVVHTPAGDIPLAGSTWHVTDYWHNEQKIATWAIVMAIVGFCVLTFLSLLFLLVKETVYRGTVQVTVTNGTRQYVARLPVTDQSQVAYVHQQVNYVRSLAAL